MPKRKLCFEEESEEQLRAWKGQRVLGVLPVTVNPTLPQLLFASFWLFS